MARVHDLLSKSESAQRVDVATYVTDLCEALRPITENDDRIHMEARVEAGVLIEADAAVPLGIVLTELVTNAVKYAFPAPASGTILVQLQRGEPGHAELVIRDNGIGMLHHREGSLGYGLVRSLVQQINGDIEIQSDAGVRVAISFPAA
jgi:two-component sensor histidine kinase